MKNQIIIYKSKDGSITLDVNLKDENVWLTQSQMTSLFEKDQSVISRHVNNIFKEQELDQKSNMQKMHIPNSDKPVAFYNLDVVISVGYRVKSVRGTQFRIWANQVIKNYLIQGYAINENRLKKQTRKIKELQKSVEILSDIIQTKQLDAKEATGLLKVITDYTYALDLLDKYDHQKLKITDTNLKPVFTITYKEAKSAIIDLAKQFKKQGEIITLFGQERDQSLKSALYQIYQTFDEKELYPSIEEKAAHLLYFVIKNHPFVDGNKRIGAFLFVWYLERNKYLYHKDGSKRIEDNALVAICLMLAQSRPNDKDIMVKLAVNLINKKN